jgi:hypothetical protein
MLPPDRRKSPLEVPDTDTLREGLTHAQKHTLAELEHFSWALRWVRRPMFRDPVPIVFDRKRERFVVILPDGSIDEQPGIVIRE